MVYIYIRDGRYYRRPSLDDYDNRWLEYSDYVTAGEQDALADFKFERISNAD